MRDEGRDLETLARDLATDGVSRRTALRRLLGVALGAAMPGTLLAGSARAGSVCTPGEQIPCYEPSTGCVFDNVSGDYICQGTCRAGTRTCLENGSFGECVGDVGPSAEVCDGLDNDCDGVVDNGFPVGEQCNNGLVGACYREGVMVCNGAGDGVVCDAPAGQPQQELCNGLDDDCDGQTDEDFPDLGQPCQCPNGESSVRICSADGTTTECSCDAVVPDTTITRDPGDKTTDRTPKFKFTSDVDGATFECSIDNRPFKECSSPHVTRRLSFGRHVFKVRAVSGGASDPTPARHRFKVIRGS